MRSVLQQARGVPIVMVAALVIGWSAGCGRPATPSSILIGATLPLSGAESDLGRAFERGYKRAVDEANARGGLRIGERGSGVRVALELRDDKGDPSVVERLAEELYARGCLALVATASDVRSAMQAALADRLGRPYVVNRTDAPGLPGSHQQWVFSVAAAGEVDERAYQTAVALLAAIGEAGSSDVISIRNALRARSPNP